VARARVSLADARRRAEVFQGRVKPLFSHKLTAARASNMIPRMRRDSYIHQGTNKDVVIRLSLLTLLLLGGRSSG